MIRGEIVEAIARSLYVQAYANYMEEEEIPDSEREGLPRPGPRQDWYDFAPATTEAAILKACEAALEIEALNGCSLDELYSRSCAACKGQVCVNHDPDHFGAMLGFMIEGAGISWSDDHVDLPLELPLIEFSIVCRGEVFDPIPVAPLVQLRSLSCFGKSLKNEAWRNNVAFFTPTSMRSYVTHDKPRS